MKKIIIVTFLFITFFAVNIFAADYGNITITEIQPFGSNTASGMFTRHGYSEYKFLVQNRDNKSHKVKITLESNGSNTNLSTLLSTDAIEVAAGSHAVLRLFQPPILIFTGSMIMNAVVNIDGWNQSDQIRITCDHMNSYSASGNDDISLCFSQQVHATIRDFFTRQTTEPPQEATPQTSAPIPHRVSSIAVKNTYSKYSNVPVDEWSDLWIAYTKFDCVIMTATEWNGLITRKPTVLNAIRRYVETGGMLVIIGNNWDIPADWNLIFSKIKNVNNSNDSGASVVCGKVFVIDAASEEIATKPQLFNNIMTQISQSAKIAKSGVQLAQQGNESRRYNFNTSSKTSRMNDILPVIEKYSVNIKLILVLIIVFAILIGPVNVFVLRSLNRRIWLIWTVPTTSLITSFIVLAASFMSEGFLKQSSSETWTILDQRRGTATSFGFIGYYSTFSTGNLNFSSDIELMPFMNGGTGNFELRMSASGNQILAGGGWILPRVPAHFSLRKNQVQQKLNIAFNWTDSDKPTATNGLGVNINSLLVCSPTGEFFETNGINAGGQKVLTRAAKVKSTSNEIDFYSNLRITQQSILSNGTNISNELILFPNSYKAEISDWNPFIEEGIPNMKPFKRKNTILGLF
ncbi:MAG: hypothetical protein LBE18_08835 [Planctomycetaceae bacterium]|jgi:hypothetical protein|nr:hypothetical protein [Planctomycetaceae bacterium]